MKTKICELCQHEEASVHCASDSAFLCFACDAKVHGANFLVARHVRRPICSRCGSLANLCFSGAGAGCGPEICQTCCGTNEEFDHDDSSSSSACISGTGSVVSAPRKRRNRKMDRICSTSSVTEGAPERISGEVESRRNNRSGRWQGVDPKAEGVLVIWFRRLGLSEGESIDRAHRALGFCNGRFTLMPLRVLLAAAAWLSLSTCGEHRMMRKLEEVSGVPRKLILALQAKLARLNKAVVVSDVGRSDLEEGWAECSP